MTKNILMIFLLVSLLCGCGRQHVPKVVESQEVIPEYAVYYESLEEIAEDSEAIVRGKTTALEYFVVDNGIIWTKQTFLVEENLYGDIAAGQSVNIYRMGGRVPIEDYLASYPKSAQAEMREKYRQYNSMDFIEQACKGAEAVEIGRNEVAFLSRCEVFSDDAGDYWRVGAEMGELLGGENADGNYSGYLGEYSLEQIRGAVHSVHLRRDYYFLRHEVIF